MFSTKQTVKLTGLTQRQILYIVEKKLINKETRQGKKIVFTFSELLELKIIGKLRKKCSLQQLRKVKFFLIDIGLTSDLRDKSLILDGNEVYLVQNQKMNHFLIQLTGKYQGQIANPIILGMEELVDELEENAVKNKIPLYPENNEELAS